METVAETTPLQQMQPPHGYFLIKITSLNGSHLLSTNNERAFVVSQLQDLLSHRLLLDALPAHKQLASCIDLIAFSITRQCIQLVVFCIDTSIAAYFVNCISGRISQYKSDLSPARSDSSRSQSNIQAGITRLRGPHHAMQQTIKTHLIHSDWEFDRYSSIGFYLHDRRGDWMRIWRIAKLYDQDQNQYLRFIKQEQQLVSRLNPLPAHCGVSYGSS